MKKDPTQQPTSFLIAILFALLLTACDVIQGPYIIKDDYEDETCILNNFPPLPPTIVQKTVLEEYTGHTCSNCYMGHQKMQELSRTHGEKLVCVSIHAGVYAEPENGTFSYDFRTSFGNEINKKFDVGAYPSGTVARLAHEGQMAYALEYWSSIISERLRATPPAAIQIINLYDPHDKKLCTNIKVTMIDNYPRPLRLSVYLTETDLIKPQQMPDDKIDENYTHRHVLRHAFNTTWGVRILEGKAVRNAEEIKRYSVRFDKKDWVYSNCSVVVYLIDEASGSILQAEEVKI